MPNKARQVNTLLIGLGYHARRIYFPYLVESKFCKLVACFDLSSQEERIKKYLVDKKVNTPCFFTEDAEFSDQMSAKDRRVLEEVVKRYSVEAVIISTEPLAHLKYAAWAVKKGLHVLMDKPVTTALDASVREGSAKKIFTDFERLKRLYQTQVKKKNLIFHLQSQRRFHIGFKKVREYVKEIALKTGCPITSIETFHADGQWTFPNEFISQTYHPYNLGFGKMSHSGYHSLDVALWLSMATLAKDKEWDGYSLYSQFVRPSDVYFQVNAKDYNRIFGKGHANRWGRAVEKQLKSVAGEVDCNTSLTLTKGKRTVTSITCNCLHNSYSRRAWFDSSNKDLYKGNGRVRQESYIIEQGPFQSIIVNSLQADEILKNGPEPYAAGGEYHFDIHVFRNSALFPEYKSYEKLTIENLSPVKDKGYSRGHQEDARRNCMRDFFLSIIGNIPPISQGSNILDHEITVKILSSIYLSGARQFKGGGGVIKGKLRIDPIWNKKNRLPK